MIFVRSDTVEPDLAEPPEWWQSIDLYEGMDGWWYAAVPQRHGYVIEGRFPDQATATRSVFNAQTYLRSICDPRV